MQKREWRGQERPPEYEVKRNGGQPQLTLYADAREEPGTEGAEGAWRATAVTLPIGVTDYGSIVSALVEARYGNEEMQAVVNNFLRETDVAQLIEMLRTTQNLNKLRQAMGTWLEGRDPEAVSEYEAMQAWRRQSKETAARIAAELNKESEVNNG